MRCRRVTGIGLRIRDENPHGAGESGWLGLQRHRQGVRSISDDKDLDFQKGVEYCSGITKPPEGLGVRLASAGPFFIFGWLYSRWSIGTRAMIQITKLFSASSVALTLMSCALPTGAPQPSRIQFGPTIRIDRARGEVTIDAQVAARIGWLEQLVCKAGTREHESLLAVEVAPSMIHAALLAAGYEPGTPGSWVESSLGKDGEVLLELKPPRGDRVDLFVRFQRDGMAVEQPLSEWVRGESVSSETLLFPSDQFVFAGSLVRPNPKSLGPGEHFVADYTGSIVGLVTFGDELIAFESVIPDRVEFAEALWEAWTDRIPPEGTPVELIIRRRE